MTEHNVINTANIHAMQGLGPFASRSALLAATPAVADIGKSAIQSDTNAEWALASVSPLIWRRIAGAAPINTVSGTTYAPAITDLDCIVETTGSSAILITLQLVASVPVPAGDSLVFCAGGTGQITLAHVSGSSNIKSSGSLLSKGQYAFLVATHMGSDIWFVTGDRA